MRPHAIDGPRYNSYKSGAEERLGSNPVAVGRRQAPGAPTSIRLTSSCWHLLSKKHMPSRIVNNKNASIVDVMANSPFQMRNDNSY